MRRVKRGEEIMDATYFMVKISLLFIAGVAIVKDNPIAYILGIISGVAIFSLINYGVRIWKKQ